MFTSFICQSAVCVCRTAHRKCSETNTHRNKRLDTRSKYPKRCKEKYQKNLFRLSFKPDLANCGRLTKIDSTHWRQRFSTTRNVFFLWSTGRAIHLGWTWPFKLMFTLFVPPFICLSSKLISIEYWVTDLNGTRSTMFYQLKILLGILLLLSFRTTRWCSTLHIK